MVSDSDLVARLREILRDSNLDTAAAGSVRRQLEEDFSVDLSDRKGFVRGQIDIFLETLNQQNEKEEQGPESENAKLPEEEESKGEGNQKTRMLLDCEETLVICQGEQFARAKEAKYYM